MEELLIILHVKNAVNLYEPQTQKTAQEED